MSSYEPVDSRGRRRRRPFRATAQINRPGERRLISLGYHATKEEAERVEEEWWGTQVPYAEWVRRIKHVPPRCRYVDDVLVGVPEADVC